MGRARAVGLALAAVLGFSEPAVAPSSPAPVAAPASERSSCAPLAPLAIALGCDDAAFPWLGASILELDALAARPARDAAAVRLLLPEQLGSPASLARVPEPKPLLFLAIGLGGLATARTVRVRSVAEHTRSG